MATLYLDLVNGSNANNGTSFALRKKDLSSFTLSAGDVVRVMGSPAPVALSVTCTLSNQSKTVTLSGAVTTNITLCESVWTASGGTVTCTLNSSTKREGSNSAQAAIASGFTTGKVAHFATGTLDLSGYQQISFWIRCTNNTVAANTFRIRLSTDTTGDTATHDFVINRALNQDRWTPITLDNGSAMNSAIASIALVADSDPGTATILLDNILACKAPSNDDALTLQSLIGLNVSGDKTWYPIKNINGTTVIIDETVNSSTTTGRGYSGTGGSGLTLYRRETIKTAIAATSTTKVQTPGQAGSSGNPITISGGWDTTDMSTQTLDTITDGLDGFGYCWSAERAFITWERIGMTRYDTGIAFTTAGTDNVFNSVICSSGCTTNGIFVRGSNNTFTDLLSIACNGAEGLTSQTDANNVIITSAVCLSNSTKGLNAAGNNNNRWRIGTITCSNNGSTALDISGAAVNITTAATLKHNGGSGMQVNSLKPSVFMNVISTNNSLYGINFNQASFNNHQFRNLTCSSNTSGDIGTSSITQGELILYNASLGSGTKIESLNGGRDIRVRSQNEGDVSSANKIYSDGGQGTPSVIAQTVADSDRHTASGLAWKLTPGSTNRDELYPAYVPIKAIGFNGGSLISFTCWVKRSVTTMSARVRIPGGKVAGVDSDVIVNCTGAANTYQQLTIDFTPSEAGVLDIIFEAWGTTSEKAVIDDFEF